MNLIIGLLSTHSNKGTYKIRFIYCAITQQSVIPQQNLNFHFMLVIFTAIANMWTKKSADFSVLLSMAQDSSWFVDFNGILGILDSGDSDTNIPEIAQLILQPESNTYQQQQLPQQTQELAPLAHPRIHPVSICASATTSSNNSHILQSSFI